MLPSLETHHLYMEIDWLVINEGVQYYHLLEQDLYVYTFMIDAVFLFLVGWEGVCVVREKCGCLGQKPGPSNLRSKVGRQKLIKQEGCITKSFLSVQSTVMNILEIRVLALAVNIQDILMSQFSYFQIQI